jgi:hypothetical protein
MKPDYRVLRMMTGNKSFDAVWAEEYGKALASHWRTWAYDPADTAMLSAN